MEKKNSKVGLSQIETLEQALDEVPTRNATEVSKARAIAMIAPKLHAMRGKGYAWRDIAAWLTEHGVTVTAPALQRYLRGVKPALAERSGARAPRRRGDVSVDTRMPQAPTVTQNTNVGSPQPEQRAARPLTQPIAPAATQAPGPHGLRSSGMPRRSSEGV